MAIASHPSSSSSSNSNSNSARHLSPVTTFIKASSTTQTSSSANHHSSVNHSLVNTDGEQDEQQSLPMSNRLTFLNLVGAFDGRDKILSLLQPSFLLLHHLLTTSPLFPLPRFLLTLLLRPKTRSLALKRIYLFSESISNLKKLLSISQFFLEILEKMNKDSTASFKLEEMKKKELLKDNSLEGKEMIKLQNLSIERSLVDEESKEIPHLEETKTSFDSNQSSNSISSNKSPTDFTYHHRSVLNTILSIFFILPSSTSNSISNPSIFPNNPRSFLEFFSNLSNTLSDSLDLISFLGGTGIAWQFGLNSRRRKGLQRLAVYFAFFGGVLELLLIRGELKGKRKEVRLAYEGVMKVIDLDADREIERRERERKSKGKRKGKDEGNVESRIEFDGCGPPGGAFTTSTSKSSNLIQNPASSSNPKDQVGNQPSKILSSNSTSIPIPSPHSRDQSQDHQSLLPKAESILQNKRLKLQYVRSKYKALMMDLIFNSYEVLLPKREKEGTEAFLGVVGGIYGLKAEWLNTRWELDDDDDEEEQEEEEGGDVHQGKKWGEEGDTGRRTKRVDREMVGPRNGATATEK